MSAGNGHAGLKLFVWIGVQFEPDVYGDVLALNFDIEAARQAIIDEYENTEVDLDLLAGCIDEQPDIFDAPVVWADAYKNPPGDSTIMPVIQKQMYGIWTKPGHA